MRVGLHCPKLRHFSPLQTPLPVLCNCQYDFPSAFPWHFSSTNRRKKLILRSWMSCMNPLFLKHFKETIIPNFSSVLVLLHTSQLMLVATCFLSFLLAVRFLFLDHENKRDFIFTLLWVSCLPRQFFNDWSLEISIQLKGHKHPLCALMGKLVHL